MFWRCTTPHISLGSFAMDVNEAVQLGWAACQMPTMSYVSLNPAMAEVAEFKLPEDSIVLAIVESKALALANGVSQKNTFLCTHQENNFLLA
ncbi:hypothetical protein HID58_095237 [Brassica napus]|uniref:Uncharacterized protein n=1 Tax=Brassica napus TaxID=3708 RepID=A0ABQ7X6L8_BRANA|nr:hypothetical protein HID58_095237 [Brassica napus]